MEAGKNLVYVCPPAAWAAAPLFARFPAPAGDGLQTVVLTPGIPAALAMGDCLARLPAHHPVHIATGLARTEHLLRARAVRTLVATPPDALELARRAALKLEGLRRIVVGWPEGTLQLGQGAALDTLLSEAAGAQRVIMTESEPAIADFLERHARRTPLVLAALLPDAPVGPATYAVVDASQIRAAAAAALDVLNPAAVAVWGPGPAGGERDPAGIAGRLPGARIWSSGDPAADLAIALDLPSAGLLGELRATARDVLVLVAAWQLPYLARIAAPLKPLRLPGAPDRARDQVFALRQRLRERLQGGELAGELLILEPLFDEHDPALVAAAALALGQAAAPSPAPAADLPAWVRIRVNVGRRNDVRVADLVGGLLNGVRLAKDDVGKIDLHDGFALVDVRPAVAEQAVRELNGMSLRGRRLTVAIDRR